MAERIATALRASGVATFFSPTNIRGAQQWQDEILKALQRCDWFLVLLSPASIQSMWVRRETAFALAEERYENRIVPLMYRACDLGPLEWLKLSQIVDFQSDFRTALTQLLDIWDLPLRSA